MTSSRGRSARNRAGRLFVLGLTAALGCGGQTTGTSASSTSSSSSSSSSGGDRACTEIGCADGATVAFSFREPGRYEVTVDLDGATVTCRTSLPLPKDGSDGCDSQDVLLTRSGSMLPVDQQSVGPLTVKRTTAKTLGVTVTRDGEVLASKTFAPIPWVTRPGPNGPGCEPATCVQASLTL